MQVKVLTWENFNGRRHGTVGSSMWRGEWLVDAWDEATQWQNGDYADVMIYQKAYWYSHWEDFKGIKILDLCDPDWMRIEEGEPSFLIKKAEALVDAFTVSSQGLHDSLKKYTKKPVVLIPDRVNLRYCVSEKTHTKKAGCVVWFGYYHNQQIALPPILPTLNRLGLELLVISNVAFHPSVSYGVRIINRDWSWHDAFQVIQTGDISINPQPDIGLIKYKSSNKTILAQALGVPVAKNGDDLERLLDPIERTKQCAIDKEEIKHKWDIRLSVDQYRDLICAIEKSKK